MNILEGKQTSQLLQYVYSSDIDAPFKVKVGTLEGERPSRPHQDIIQDPVLRRRVLSATANPNSEQTHCILSDLVVTVEIFSDGQSLALPTQTSYKPFTTRYNWNEWLTLPMKFSDLPRESLLAFTVWDLHGPREMVPVGGSTMSIFKKSGAMRQGMHDLKLWPDTKADGSSNTTTPGKTTGSEAARLIKLSKRHFIGEIEPVEWMDRMTFREIEIINDREKKKSNQMYLMIEFPRVVYNDVEHMVVYFEKDLDVPCQIQNDPKLAPIYDPDVCFDNLVDEKHHKVYRNERTQDIERDLRPDNTTKIKLSGIISKCSTTPMTMEEKDLIWKYRFFLKSNKKALPKFVHCVKWTNSDEIKLALDVMSEWEPMEVEDALELLGPQFTHLAVRKYAVKSLEQASDEDLVLYLLQLVQALKYEPGQGPSKTFMASMPRAYAAGEADSTSLSVETCDDTESIGSNVDSIASAMLDEKSQMDVTAPLEEVRDLTSFLIKRACRSDILASNLYWYLTVESEGNQNSPGRNVNRESKRATEHCEMYGDVLRLLVQCLKNGNREQALRRQMILKQQTFVTSLVALTKSVAAESDRQKRIAKLQSLLKDPTDSILNLKDGVPLPLNPSIRVKGVDAEKLYVYKSALKPCKIVFQTEDDSEYAAIFKNGDDLRQDQLIVQMITLMDKLLRRDNQDLKLTPYAVLATSTKHGFVEYVESRTVTDIMTKDLSIQNYFRKCAPCDKSDYGISPTILDNYVKSCAGYSVITYILGIRDRHLENLLLTKTGQLFHIDFGYILGRDPKPFMPLICLHAHLIDGMGGLNSPYYNQFKQQCFTAMLNLRKHANLILNLFSLMVDASIPEIALEPDKTVKKVEVKFLLHLTEEQVVSELSRIIDQSAASRAAAVAESIHNLGQTFRP